jgi:hypothetical protein
MEATSGDSGQETNEASCPSQTIGYHVQKIRKGTLGEISKLREELDELEDAHAQGARVLALCELSDLVGAISHYLRKHFRSITFDDLIKMAELTERAFKCGER